jgi:hypothetical protein
VKSIEPCETGCDLFVTYHSLLHTVQAFNLLLIQRYNLWRAENVRTKGLSQHVESINLGTNVSSKLQRIKMTTVQILWRNWRRKRELTRKVDLHQDAHPLQSRFAMFSILFFKTLSCTWDNILIDDKSNHDSQDINGY